MNVVARLGWRTPLVIVISGCAIAILTFGPRSALGFFLTPLSQANGWGRDVFGLALAIQNLLWGIGQPFAGAIADRYGTVRVLCVGAILYAIGLALMAYSQSPGMLHLSAGVLIGFGLAGCSFNIVLSAFGKLVPESWRSLSFGAGTAAGSFGQFLFSPLSVSLQDAYGWQSALLIFAGLTLLVLPLSLALATPRAGAASPLSIGAEPRSSRAALGEAVAHRS
ncbi:MAG: MFS transporter, partial [Rhodoplanes sp.]